jgi:hypothetical protein
MPESLEMTEAERDLAHGTLYDLYCRNRISADEFIEVDLHLCREYVRQERARLDVEVDLYLDRHGMTAGVRNGMRAGIAYALRMLDAGDIAGAREFLGRMHEKLEEE